MSSSLYTPAASDIIKSSELRDVVRRLEKLEEDKKDISEEIKSVYQEAESSGFNIKVLKHVIKLKKKQKSELEEEDELIEVYRNALGV
jgi:uncharacterized protein (UPF0335 family)